MPTDARILLVEDDPKLAELIREFLERYGMEVSIEGRGDTAVARVLVDRPDAVVLDLMLPGMDGMEICRQLRPAYAGGILMLTARGDDYDEVVGLEIGADDYLIKPVRPRVLLARLNALLRRLERAPSARPERGLAVDQTRRKISLDGAPLSLTDAEYELLAYLALRPGQVLSREQLYQEIRGIRYDGVDRSIDLRISRIRKKLGDRREIIRSIRGGGYLLVPE